MLPRLLTACVLCTSLAAQAPSQAPWPAPLPKPAPWPEDGRIPPDMAKTYVFEDVATGDLICLARTWERQGVPSKERSVLRYRVGKNIVPSVRVKVARDPEGRFGFSYEIGNHSAAGEAISMVDMAWPCGRSDCGQVKVRAPANWRSIKSTRALASFVSYAGLQIGSAGAVAWATASQGTSENQRFEPIFPGTTRGGFEFAGPALPGPVLFFLKNGEPELTQMLNPAATDFPDDDELDRQNEPFATLEFRSRIVVTIGPRFEPGTPPREMAEVFRVALRTLARQGTLPPKSAFREEALSFLESVIAGGIVPRSGKAFTAEPTDSLEQEFAAAIRMAFNR